MDTLWLLAAKYDGSVFIPIDLVCRDFFQHLSPAEFMRKVGKGAIALPVVRMDVGSKQSAKGVHLHDLAEWIDYQRQAARSEAYELSKASHLKPSRGQPTRSLGQTELSYNRTVAAWERAKGVR